MNVPDNEFHELIQQFSGRSTVLVDNGFRKKDGAPENCKLCAKGTWNDRTAGETSFSLLTVICSLKQMYYRLASAVVLSNVLLILFHQRHPDADSLQMRIAEFL